MPYYDARWPPITYYASVRSSCTAGPAPRSDCASNLTQLDAALTEAGFIEGSVLARSGCRRCRPCPIRPMQTMRGARSLAGTDAPS